MYSHGQCFIQLLHYYKMNDPYTCLCNMKYLHIYHNKCLLIHYICMLLEYFFFCQQLLIEAFRIFSAYPNSLQTAKYTAALTHKCCTKTLSLKYSDNLFQLYPYKDSANYLNLNCHSCKVCVSTQYKVSIIFLCTVCQNRCLQLSLTYLYLELSNHISILLAFFLPFIEKTNIVQYYICTAILLALMPFIGTLLTTNQILLKII